MYLVHETDYGTPAAKSSEMVTLTIDGRSVTVPAGTSIMRAAMEIGTQVPKLCATDSVDAFGSCRLCLVEIEGRPGTPASCTTPVANGIVGRTQTERLKQLRKGVMELYISDHPLDCLTCAANGDCELQDMAGAVGLREVRYGYDGENHTTQAKDESNPYFTFDPSKCIVCSRCVRACEEVQGTFALTIPGRGFDSKCRPAWTNRSWSPSACRAAPACRPARRRRCRRRAVIEIGTPEHSVVTTCAYCGVGCSLQGRDAGRGAGAHGPLQGRQGQPRPFLREGPLRLGLRHHRDRILKPMIRETITSPGAR
jgi:formate dehydrogenase major subunit